MDEQVSGINGRLLTVAEAAEYLRLSNASVYNLIKQKKLPCIRVSQRRLVVTERDLSAYIQRQRGLEPGQFVFMLDGILGAENEG